MMQQNLALQYHGVANSFLETPAISTTTRCRDDASRNSLHVGLTGVDKNALNRLISRCRTASVDCSYQGVTLLGIFRA